MTVADLIQELEKVEDKTKEVFYCDEIGQAEICNAKEFDDAVYLDFYE